jgi:DNA-binding MarR family transcriptional regulator
VKADDQVSALKDEPKRQSSSAAARKALAEPPFRTVGFRLSSLGYAVSRRFRATLAPLQLEPREFALLRAVAAAEGLSQQEIGERLQIPASRMVAFVDTLQQRGLVERRINPQDRRARALHLTTAGRRLLGRAITAAMSFEQELCGELSEGERVQLLDMLERIAAQIGLSPSTHSAHAHREGEEL